MDSISPDAPLKQCSKCKQWKPATTEYFHRTGKRLNSYCKVCASKYYKTNKARLSEQAKQYRASHKEDIRLYDRQYRESHKEYLQDYERHRRRRSEAYRQFKHQYNKDHAKDHAVYCRQHRAIHRETYLAHERHRQALKKSIPGKHSVEQIQEQLRRQKYRCYYAACGHAKFQRVKGEYVYHIDHTFPMSRVTGTDIPANDMSYLVLTCPTCNIKKGNKFPWEWSEGGRLL